MGIRPSPFAPFRNRLFLTYWLTGLIANFGWLIQMVGASWLMTSIGGTAEMVALVQTSVAAPVMLFSLTAGALADNLGRRTIVLWSQSFLFIVSCALAFVTWEGWITPWMLLGFTFAIGCGKALNNPAWQTYISEFMPREEMPQAVALNSVGFNFARSVGPAIGGAIVALVGAFAAFVVNALSNVGMIIVMLNRKSTARARELPPEPVGRAMLVGIRYVAMSPNMLLVMVRSLIFNLTAISVMSLMPLIARDNIGGGPQTFGFLLGAFGVGAIGSALAGARLREHLSLEGVARVGFLSFAAATVMIALSTNMVFTLLGTAFAGASWLLTLSAFNATVQMSAPRWVVSRCHALYQTAAFAGNAAGSWIWGLLAASQGTTVSLLVSAVGLVLGTLFGLRFALRELRDVNLDPHSRWVAPKVALDIQPRSGPVVTTIEYRIADEDLPEFLALMEQRRRSRFRDGARGWGLERDIEQPEFWTERYVSPTWTEMLRHHERRTISDAELGSRLRALQKGEPPLIRHFIDRHPGSARIDHVLPDPHN